MAIIWGHLVLHKNFFKHYKSFLEKKLDVSSAESAKNTALTHYDYTIYYQLFLEAIRRLSLTSRKFAIGKEVYVTKELIQNLLLELAQSLSTRFWVYENGISKGNPVVEHVICPCVSKELAKEQDGRTLWSDEWLQVIQKMVHLSTSPNDGVTSSVRLRPVMYIFLIMNRCSQEYQTLTAPKELLRTINLLLPAIDNRCDLFKLNYKNTLEQSSE